MTTVGLYFRNLYLWARGIHWLWTRELEAGEAGYYDRENHLRPVGWGIRYKPGWGPWKFLPVYLTTYLAGTLAGYGVVSLSRAWAEREQMDAYSRGNYPFARFMTRFLNWIFPGSQHGVLAGPRLWGSVNLRDM